MTPPLVTQPQPHPALALEQLRNSPAQRVDFVTYASVRQQMVDAGVQSALSQQHCWGRERLLRGEGQTLQVLEVARAADAQAAMLRIASNQPVTLQLVEAESRARILPEGGQGRERLLWEAAGATT